MYVLGKPSHLVFIVVKYSSSESCRHHAYCVEQRQRDRPDEVYTAVGHPEPPERWHPQTGVRPTLSPRRLAGDISPHNSFTPSLFQCCAFCEDTTYIKSFSSNDPAMQVGQCSVIYYSVTTQYNRNTHIGATWK